jgi:hypothetical protein
MSLMPTEADRAFSDGIREGMHMADLYADELVKAQAEIENLRASNTALAALGTKAADDAVRNHHRAVNAEAEIERLRKAITDLVETFEKDEAQGYRSKDRQFAISILRKALSSE